MHEKLYTKYYEIRETPVRRRILIPKQETIAEVEKNYGYFALISNGVKDPLDALEIYRSKDLMEKAFGNLKERLNMRRTSVSSEENLEGKLLVQFVALIYLSYIKKSMSDHDLFRNYTMQELFGPAGPHRSVRAAGAQGPHRRDDEEAAESLWILWGEITHLGIILREFR